MKTKVECNSPHLHTHILKIFILIFKILILKKIMELDQQMETNNLSTIATFIAICITGILAYFGYNVDQGQLATVVMSVITLIIAVWSSKNPNTLAVLGNAKAPVTSESDVLNDEYVTGEDDDI